jgi:hypothetical protein
MPLFPSKRVKGGREVEAIMKKVKAMGGAQ